VELDIKVIKWDKEKVIRMKIWDIEGKERFGNMKSVYYKEEVGEFIVFDVNRDDKFEEVVKWKMDLDKKVKIKDGRKINCVIIENKCDKKKEGIVKSDDRMDE
jgi:Ras-related protein Rab-32